MVCSNFLKDHCRAGLSTPIKSAEQIVDASQRIGCKEEVSVSTMAYCVYE